MKITEKITTLGLLAAMTTALLSPMAMAQTQSDKNTSRNIGIGGAALLGYGLLKHNGTATLLGAAAGGYGAYKYEQDRKKQAERSRARARYHSRHHYYHHGN